MTMPTHRLSLIAAALALATGLAACNKAEERTAGQQLDSAIAKSEEAAKEAQNKAAEMGRDVQSAAKEAGAEMKDAANQAGAEIKEAATAAGGAMDDVGITASVNAGLAKDPDLSAIRIDVDTKDGVVTLNGPAPNAGAKERAESIAKAVNGVKSVDNKLTVNPS